MARKNRKDPIATDTRCPAGLGGGRRCGGGLFRPGDGADKLSEYLGRIVLQCDRCGQRWTVHQSTGELYAHPQKATDARH